MSIKSAWVEGVLTRSYQDDDDKSVYVGGVFER
jgi:hypothetical protein